MRIQIFQILKSVKERGRKIENLEIKRVKGRERENARTRVKRVISNIHVCENKKSKKPR